MSGAGGRPVGRPRPWILPLSASTPAIWTAKQQAVSRALDTLPPAVLPAFVEGLALADGGHPHRAVVVGEDPPSLRDALLAAEPVEVQGPPPRIAFLFTGQGAQFDGMNEPLCARFSVFRGVTDRLAAAWPEGAHARVDRTGTAQPALVSFALAAAALWQRLGVTPDVVLGHSVGELAAAGFAGAMSWEDAVRLAVARGALMEALPAGGAMASVGVGEAAMRVALLGLEARVSIAAINAPDQVVISGDAEAVHAVVGTFADQGVAGQRLAVSHAFHSHRMDPMLADFGRIAAEIATSTPALPVVSNLDGAVHAGPIAAETWVRHVREPVRFAAGAQAAAALGVDAWVEVGPQPVLLGLLGRLGLPGERVATLRRGRGAEVLLDGLARLYRLGVRVDWGAAFGAPEGG